MSVPSIPNLLSLRGASRGGRGRGRGRGGPGGGGPSSVAARSHDATIQGTDNDAAVSRLCAVELGYLEDPFAPLFVPAGPSSRRLPIINRGTYTRTTALDRLVTLFLSHTSSTPDEPPPPRQIVSLGAGTDTRSLRLFSDPGRRNITYHEIDFPTIVAKKLQTVKMTPGLQQVLPSPTVDKDGSWHSEAPNGNQLWCHGIDLREFAAHGPDIPARTALPGLRTDVPTLVVSECCLCYLEPPDARAVVDWFAEKLPNMGIVLYEPVQPDDAFGRMMVSNLAARRIRMPTLDVFRTSADQEARLREIGCGTAQALRVDQIWERWVSPQEKERVDALEGLDEVEEWLLLAGHYVVAWGSRGAGFENWTK